jgi:hypothetical protein
MPKQSLLAAIPDYAKMHQTLVEIQRLLQELVAHLSDATKLSPRKVAFKLR